MVGLVDMLKSAIANQSLCSKCAFYEEEQCVYLTYAEKSHLPCTDIRRAISHYYSALASLTNRKEANNSITLDAYFDEEGKV